MVSLKQGVLVLVAVGVAGCASVLKAPLELSCTPSGPGQRPFRLTIDFADDRVRSPLLDPREGAASPGLRLDETDSTYAGQASLEGKPVLAIVVAKRDLRYRILTHGRVTARGSCVRLSD